MTPKTAALALCWLLASPALARELNGVKMPDTVTVEGKSLALNGMGLRRKFVFKVYVAGLYVEHPSQDAVALVASEQVKRVQMSMLRTLGKEKIVEAIKDGFERNAKAQLPALQERLEKFTARIPDAKEGDQLIITYVPGKGTVVEGKGEEVVVPGKDFADGFCESCE